MRRVTCLIALVAFVFSGCGFFLGGDPEVVAHRAGAGNWPENSRSAVLGSVARQYPGIEIDIVLTKDKVPVLAHEPWLNEKHCNTVDGKPVSGRILIRDLTLAEVQAKYRCGARVDPEHPEVTPVPETLMTLDEVLAALVRAPRMVLYLDLKFDPDFTLSARDFAAAITGRWNRAALPNRLFVESTLSAGVEAFRGKKNLEVVFGWPRFTPDGSDIGTALGGEFLIRLAITGPFAQARAQGAKGIALPYQLVDVPQLRALRDDGVKIFLYTLNDASRLDTFCSFPVEFVMTDYPERAPCLPRP